MDERKKIRSGAQLDVYGKVPPQAHDLEQAVLGAILVDKGAYYKVSTILKPKHFYVEAHNRIFNAFVLMDKKGWPIDLLTTVEQLKSTEELDIVGGMYAISKLTNDVVSGANINRHSRIILQKYIQREIIKIGAEAVNNAYEDSIDPLELLDKTQGDYRDISMEIDNTFKKPIEDELAEMVLAFSKKAEYSRSDEEDPDAIYTGVPEWDRINGQLFAGVYVVAARPAVGKGVLLTELIARNKKKPEDKDNPEKKGKKLGVINGEMTNKQLYARLATNLHEINNFIFKKRIDITEEEEHMIADALQEILNLDFDIYHEKDIDAIARRIISWVLFEDVKWVAADLLTIFTISEEKAKYMTDRQQMNYKLKILNHLSTELGVPIILFTHMNRDVEKRSIKEPVLSDLKETGNIEDFAFQVMFLHRPELYEHDREEDEWGETIRGLMYGIILKHRDGELGRIKWNARMHMSKLTEREDSVLAEWKPSASVPFDYKSAAAGDDTRLLDEGSDIGVDDDDPF